MQYDESEAIGMIRAGSRINDAVLAYTRGIWKVHALAIYLLRAFIKPYKSIHFLKEQFNVDLMVYFLSVYVPTILLQIDRINTM